MICCTFDSSFGKILVVVEIVDTFFHLWCMTCRLLYFNFIKTVFVFIAPSDEYFKTAIVVAV